MDDYTDVQIAVLNAHRAERVALAEQLRHLREHPDMTNELASLVDYLIDDLED